MKMVRIAEPEVESVLIVHPTGYTAELSDDEATHASFVTQKQLTEAVASRNLKIKTSFSLAQQIPGCVTRLNSK